MRVQDHIVDRIGTAAEDAFRAARAVPEDRLLWRPLEIGQPVLEICRELALTPDWAYWVLTDAKPDDPERAAAQQRAERESWGTIEACEAACRAKLVRLFEFYRGLTDERLAQTRWLPFNGGRDHTTLELLDYPRWNLVYHTGQIELIRSMVAP